MLDNLPDTVESARFGFGRNWLSFIDVVDEARIGAAGDSLLKALHLPTLSGRTFLDVGCGSGLFSLAASRLGAYVRSFDYDQDSVLAATELRRRFAPGSDWQIEQGSILDPDFVADLGRFDIVYSWGVLHHTGHLWAALDATARLVAPGGLLYTSVYNDQGLASRVWRQVKRHYNSSGELTRAVLVAGSAIYLARHRPVSALYRAVRRVPVAPRPRGMSRRHDLIDWVGGYPFEVARPEEVFAFVHRLGFELRYLKTAGGGLGCNEYVFQAGARDGARVPQGGPGAGRGSRT
jgi:2-polyprenyl-6-hydroxyphenyl methylase/3-demethylubiquinone-9 3-methyltransferase